MVGAIGRTLIVKVLGRTASFRILEQEVKNLWQLNGFVSLLISTRGIVKVLDGEP